METTKKIIKIQKNIQKVKQQSFPLMELGILAVICVCSNYKIVRK